MSYTLTYPRWLQFGRAALAVLLAAMALIRWVQAWVQFVSPLLQGASLAAQPIRPLVAANASLLLTAGCLVLFYSFLPNLALTNEGLAVRTLLGWRTAPWSAVNEVRMVSFTQSERRLVLIQGRWGWGFPWLYLVSLCLGAGFERGILFTSAIRDFKPLMGRMWAEVERAAPHALFDDEFFSLTARLLFEPVPTLTGLIEQAREQGWPMIISAQAMAAVPAGMILVQLLVLAVKGGVWWKPLVLLAAGLAEWGAGALYIYALGGVLPGSVGLREGVLLYPIAQIPRALLALPMAMLTSAGLLFLASAIGLVAILWAVVLTALLVQQLYRLPSVLPAMAGAAIQALLQFMVLALVFGG